MRRHFLLLCAVLALVIGCASTQDGSSRLVSVQELAATLHEALPAGTSARVAAFGNADLVSYEDGAGAVPMRVSLMRVPADQIDQATACPLYSQNPYDHCVRHTLRGGTIVAVDQGYRQPLAPAGVQQWSALLATATGQFVSLTEWNAPTADADTPSRPHPPLTPDQLQSVVESTRWLPLVQRFPKPPEPRSPPTTPEMASSRIFAALRQQIPAAVRLDRKDSTSVGYVEVTVDDGHGTGLLTVTVQRWQNPNDPDLVALFQHAGRQPGGTEVTTRRQSLNGDSVQLDTDVRTPGGLRILLTQVNAPAFGLPATRPAPALSTGALTELAHTLLGQM
jgi:hypothetical protein